VTDTVASGALPLAMLVALLAGLVSFASPCVLPLVPGFLGYVTGLSDTDVRSRRRSLLVLGALLFVAGFAAVFILSSIFITSVGRVFVAERELLMRVGGVVVILMALVFLGVGASRGTQARIAPTWRPRAGLLGAPVLGAVFGIGWTPCTGPTLAAVMALSASAVDPSPARATVLAAAYSLGLGLPFLLAAAGLERFGRVSAWLRRHQRSIHLFGGGLLLLVGILLVTGWWSSILASLMTRLVAGFEVPI
jgi:cytochrome c-type biogenesis protein